MRLWLVLAVLVLWAGIAVIRRSRERMHRGAPVRADPDIDYQALEQAEREVKDLDTDAKGRPLDDALGDDWGPGTPKPPYT